MPVEKVFDISLKLTEEDLGKLDKLASRAEKKLQKQGGIFAGAHGQRALPKSFVNKEAKKSQSFESNQPAAGGERIETGGKAPITRDTFADAVEKALKKKGLLSDGFMKDAGIGRANQAFSLLKNPGAFFLNIAATVPFVAVLLQGGELLKGLMARLTVKGGPLDVFFIDRINDRLDALREKGLQKQILSGFEQIIITTASGETNPRNAYNSFDVFNRDQALLESDFAIRDTSGLTN